MSLKFLTNGYFPSPKSTHQRFWESELETRLCFIADGYYSKGFFSKCASFIIFNWYSIDSNQSASIAWAETKCKTAAYSQLQEILAGGGLIAQVWGYFFLQLMMTFYTEMLCDCKGITTLRLTLIYATRQTSWIQLKEFMLLLTALKTVTKKPSDEKVFCSIGKWEKIQGLQFASFKFAIYIHIIFFIAKYSMR